jgi:hypothetical protein
LVSDGFLPLAIFALSAALATSAGAVCLNDTSLPAEFSRSDVFIGTVVSSRHVPPLDRYFDLEGEMYRVKVNEVFRGKLRGVVDLFSENSSGRFPMEIGANYILFAYHEHGRKMVDNCGNSSVLPKGNPTVEVVRRLKRTQ